MDSPSTDHVRPIDQAVLELLRQYGGMTVQQLSTELDVTATAIRQRLERLDQLELIERAKEALGRGRPVYRYRLTRSGQRFAGASYADLASALWQEVLGLSNPAQRRQLLQRVAKRLGHGLRATVGEKSSLPDRISAAATELARRRVPAVAATHGRLPVLEFHACPYPELSEGDDSRQMCEVEQEMLSEALGQTVQLDCCLLDGHDHCQFRPVGEESPATGSS